LKEQNWMSTPAKPVLYPRISREERTITLMIDLYCRQNHSSALDLCPECQELWDYAQARLLRCPFSPDKPTCANCPVHCYKPEMRERIRRVMRFSGPRMLLRHPILTIHHLLDGWIETRRKIKE
jgi:hypothetical protein